MYKFIDTNEHQLSNHLPSEALFINGVAIEDKIEGYTTLTVTGRELISPDLNTQRRTSGDGSIYLNKTYPPRTITIQYELKAKDNQDFRQKFVELNKLLAVEQAQLQFNDDFDYSYYGTLSDVSDVPEGRNSVVGTFSFFCSDPFKYGRQKVITGSAPSIIYDETYLIKPDYINVTFNEVTDFFELTSGDKVIKIPEFSFLSGDTLPIDFVNNSMFEGYYEVMEYMSLDSDFEDFYIRSGVPIELKTSANLEIGYRERLL